MQTSLSTILLLLLTCAVTAVSQTLFKRATTLVGSVDGGNVVHRFIELLMLPSFLFALFLYGAAFVLWIVLISKNSLSLLYPIGLSLNVIFALITARIALGEAITSMHLAGIGVIIAGIFLVTR